MPMRESVPIPAHKLRSYQWMDIIKFLSAEEFNSLRLAGSKAMGLTNPLLTNHLHLRMDKASFFRANSQFIDSEAMKWLANRSKLVINDKNAAISPYRVEHLIVNGILDSVTQIAIFDCSFHRTTISQLARLPNLDSLILGDQGNDPEELESIIGYVGVMHSLTHLDIELDCVVDGTHLSFLSGLRNLKSLRLRGFDLSEGIRYVDGLSSLESLHLCHGNFYSSPDNDVSEKDLISLRGLANVRNLHLEGFDSLTGVGFGPFFASKSIKQLVVKHCQDLDEDFLVYIGRLTSLESFHVILSAYDEGPVFDRFSLQHLNSLSALKRLSLFYVLVDPADLEILRGLNSLEVLNVAFDEDIDDIGLNIMCHTILTTFTSIRKLRIFSEESLCYSVQRGKLDIEFSQFNFGDLVYLE